MSATDNTNVWITESRELILRFPDLLKMLLTDHTSGGNIIWGTDQYSALGKGFQKEDQITEKCLNDTNFSLIQPRVYKSLQNQSERTKALAEVFTAPWICNFMVNQIDYEYFGLKSLFNKSKKDNKNWAGTSKKIPFPTSDGQTWKDYVLSRRLEITCGEAPFLVSRYDVVNDGGSIPTTERIGILDRKLRVVTENAKDEKEWFEFASAAIQSCYGYEYQGDNVFVARVNILLTFSDFLEYAWKRKPTLDELKSIADIVSWNIWQMDGFTYSIPFLNFEKPISLFDSQSEDETSGNNPGLCLIKDWQFKSVFIFKSLLSLKFLRKQEAKNMKFDYIIGNPPYQEEVAGNGRSAPIYNRFMDEAYKTADKVELITPARFLFDAGQTPKDWNRKMLNDPHLKVLSYFYDGSVVFPNTDIKGGVVITYFDKTKNFGAIKEFIPEDNLKTITKKVQAKLTEGSISDSITGAVPYRFSEEVKKMPSIMKLMPKSFDLRSNIIDIFLGKLFFNSQKEKSYISIVGLNKMKRDIFWIDQKCVVCPANFSKYKVLISESNGAGHFGEIINSTVLGPNCGHTQTFISIGSFETEGEAENLAKYIKTKFFRAMLGTLKVTQHNPQAVWKNIPTQSFGNGSDIDWSKPIHEIDLQLYKKYGLDDKETAFIETKVREMK
jgi:hypothetical protein